MKPLQTLHSRQGFTTLELLIGIAILGLVVSGSYMAVNTLSEKENSELGLGTAEEVYRLGDHMIRIGRQSGLPPAGSVYRNCHVFSASPARVRCAIDLSVPPSGTPTWVRFVHRPALKEVHFEERVAPTVWEAKLIYKNIAEFIVCGDDPGCALEPTKLTAEHRAFVTANTEPELAQRFVRFRIVGESPTEGRPPIFQSAFYVRNPPFLGDTDTKFNYSRKVTGSP